MATPPGSGESAVSRYAALFYNAMFEQAEQVNGDTLFTGRLTRTYLSTGAPKGYYTKVRDLLVQQSCVEYLARGSHGAGSVVRLLHAPEKVYANHLTPAARPAILRADKAEERIARLEARLAGFNLTEILRNYEIRIAKLERKVRELEGSES